RRSPPFSSQRRSASSSGERASRPHLASVSLGKILVKGDRPRCPITAGGTPDLLSASDAQLRDHPSYPLRLVVAGLVGVAKQIDLLLRFIRRDGESILRLIGQQRAAALPTVRREQILQESARTAYASRSGGERFITDDIARAITI